MKQTTALLSTEGMEVPRPVLRVNIKRKTNTWLIAKTTPSDQWNEQETSWNHNATVDD